MNHIEHSGGRRVRKYCAYSSGRPALTIADEHESELRRFIARASFMLRASSSKRVFVWLDKGRRLCATLEHHRFPAGVKLVGIYAKLDEDRLRADLGAA